MTHEPHEIGVPAQITYLKDEIFKCLRNGEEREWPAQFIASIGTGADLSMVWPRFALWLLSAPDSPMHKAAQHGRVDRPIEGVAILYREWVELGAPPVDSRWSSAAREASMAAMASSDAARIARNAGRAFDESDAMREAAMAAGAADSAARAASDARAASEAVGFARDAARTTSAHFWSVLRDKLLELLRNASRAEGGGQTQESENASL